MIRVGIFFGGSSREREVSFSGGRTVYDNLDKSRFEAVPFFVDSFNQLVELDWQYIYKGSIRDFYPPVEFLPDSPHAYQVYAESLTEELTKKGLTSRDLTRALGKPVSFDELQKRVDFVFLALHGAFAEDGTIQGLLEWYGIPYSGSGIFPSAFGINKRLQKEFFQGLSLPGPKWTSVSRQNWLTQQEQELQRIKSEIHFPLVCKAANQGSSIGIGVVKEENDRLLTEAIDRAFFRLRIDPAQWNSLSLEEQVEQVREWVDIREGIGLPARLNNDTVFFPEDLLTRLRELADQGKEIWLESQDGETEVILETFIEGREFSCIVVQLPNGEPVALPPTEIVKGGGVFDYKSKYLPGLSRKLTPIDLPWEDIERIRKASTDLFRRFHFNVYARIDGFYSRSGEIYLNDPNTTSGMMPSSFFFHQAAEIGLNPSAFLTYIIETSLRERVRTINKNETATRLLSALVRQREEKNKSAVNRKKIAVIMGGYSSERHISVESGRNIYEKLASSTKYLPVPVFLTGNDDAFTLHLLPVNIMLKDNADDIREKVLHFSRHPAIEKIMQECSQITEWYAHEGDVLIPREIGFDELADLVDGVFIALHGRPGEDGALQKKLESVGLPYNGSGVESSSLTINKYLTNRLLEQNGFHVARAVLVEESEWLSDKTSLLKRIEATCAYPLIAKPADDGCSSAVKKLRNAEELELFAALLFRKEANWPPVIGERLQIDAREEIPMKNFFIVEELIDRQNASHFLEITGGLLTHRNPDGSYRYEIFEASEALAEKGILSLAEKFLAGQGQNITPARYARDASERQRISDVVREEFRKAAAVLKIEGYARIDAFVRVYENGQVEVIFIEVNSLPGMTPATCIFHQTAINGYKPFEFIDKILDYGFSKKKQSI